MTTAAEVRKHINELIEKIGNSNKKPAILLLLSSFAYSVRSCFSIAGNSNIIYIILPTSCQ